VWEADMETGEDKMRLGTSEAFGLEVAGCST